ncbi:hypothetical protein ACEWY4_017630 [Coilia grayii]|uniref:lysozyme n=1 Tax=Coilia grayii TaxID=363190 RepID=A0ABD1JKA6_9TELE
MKLLALGEMLGRLPAVIVVMATLVMGPGPVEGLVLSKCELKAQLEAVLADTEDEGVMEERFQSQDVLAKIICKVEHTTQFNTSQVTVLLPPELPSPFPFPFPFPGDRPGRPGPPGRPMWPGWPSRPADSSSEEISGFGSGSGSESESESESNESAYKPVRPWHPFGRPGGRPRPGPRPGPGSRPRPQHRPQPAPRRPKRASGRFVGVFPGRPLGRPQDQGAMESEEREVEREVEKDASSWMLYGLFQLADRVVCESEGTPSLNICQMPCSDLIDDDITDDTACLRELRNIHEKMKSDPEQRLLALAMRAKMMAMMYARQCFTVVASDYFAEC